MVEGEAVLLDLEGRRVLGLNAVGSFVWGLLDGRRTVAEVAEAVAARFEVTPAAAARDVTAFLADLDRRGFVQP